MSADDGNGADDPPDDELLRRWQAGDQGAGHELFKRHFPRLYAFFRPRVASDDDTQECIQKTMLRCAQNVLERRVPVLSFKGYLLGIAQNVLLEYYNAKKKGAATLDPEVDSMIELAPGPSTITLKAEEERILIHALRTLPLNDQMILAFYEVEGLTAREVGALFDLPETAVRGRVHRAKERLRAAIISVASSPELAERTTENLDKWMASLREQLAKKGSPSGSGDGGDHGGSPAGADVLPDDDADDGD